MDVLVFSKDIIPLGTINGFTSLMWNDSYWDTGTFEINCPLTNLSKNLLVEKQDRIIWPRGERTAGIIEKVTKSVDESGNGKITAKGHFTDILYNRRIVWGTLICTNEKVTNIERQLINTQCVNPMNTVRAIPHLVLGDTITDDNTSVTYQVTGAEVLGEIVSFSQSYELGYETLFDPHSKLNYFRVYKGVDRTSSQSVNKKVVFSTKIDELLSAEYSCSNESKKNIALVAGAGEGAARKTTSIDDNTSGYERRELFVDARDIADTDENGTAIPDADYLNMLSQRGTSKVYENQEVQSYECSVRVAGSHYKYGVDFYKGDIVTVIDERLGITIDARITGVNESWSDNGYQILYTFGYKQPTILQVLKRR